MLGSNIVFKSEATRWLSKWWISRRMADKVTKLTISLFLLFQCCEYFGPKHFPSEVFATCMSSGSIARFFYYIICLLQLHIINFIFLTSFIIIFIILILLRIVDTSNVIANSWTIIKHQGCCLNVNFKEYFKVKHL